ncbi:MAG: hypothetical protein MUF84_16900 [Anaerolineae bacterium]|jgi:hypothetical protein|nr:hypothetical protein [Anaerolineae bacterium]
MRKTGWFGVILLVAVMLLISALPASAGATKTPFTGRCEFVEDSGGPEPKQWYSGQRMHYRDGYADLVCDFSDDRLDGFYRMMLDWNVTEYTSPDFPYFWLIGNETGDLTAKDEGGEVLWEGGHVSFLYEPGKATGRAWLHGRGPYEGLKVQSDLWCDLMAGIGPSWSGEILDPGQ